MKKPVHYYGLDLLRLGAAALVLLDHFGAYGWAVPSTNMKGDALAFPFLAPMEDIGSIGVEIFFLISGFVIAASAKGTTASRFLTSRAIRVLPTLWLCGLVALVARATTSEPLGFLVASFLRSATLSPVGPYIDGVVWTLVVEAMFYALVFFLLLRDGFSRLDTLAKALGVASAIFLTIFSLASLLASTSDHAAHLAAICARFPFKVFLLRHGVFFALGMLLWSSFDIAFTVSRAKWMAALSVFCSLEIFFEHGGPEGIAISLAMWWGAFAVIVASVGAGERIAGWFHRVRRPVQDMGRLSYPLYLNHYVLGMVLVPVLFRIGLPTPAALALGIVLVTGSSWLIMRYPERWAQNALRRHLLKRPVDPRGEMQTVPAPV